MMVFVSVSECLFPIEWRGEWYEGGSGGITISATNISRKGVCVETEQEFYLLRNRQSHFLFWQLNNYMPCFCTHLYRPKVKIGLQETWKFESVICIGFYFLMTSVSSLSLASLPSFRPSKQPKSFPVTVPPWWRLGVQPPPEFFLLVNILFVNANYLLWLFACQLIFLVILFKKSNKKYYC